MKTRLQRDAETLMTIDRRRQNEGSCVGSSIERTIIDQHLKEIEAATIATAIVEEITREMASKDQVLPDPSAHQHCAEVAARLNDQRHAAYHELRVSRAQTAEAEICLHRRDTAVFCLLLILAAETTWLLSLMGWI